MQKPHTPSFIGGLAIGFILSLIGVFSHAIFTNDVPKYPTGAPALNTGDIPVDRLERMAERFNMTTDELKKELDAGKTIQDIASEKGVEFGGGGRGMRSSQAE